MKNPVKMLLFSLGVCVTVVAVTGTVLKWKQIDVGFNSIFAKINSSDVSRKQLESTVEEQKARILELESDLKQASESAQKTQEQAEKVQAQANIQQQKETLEQERQNACIKANELVNLSSDITIRASGESGSDGCSKATTKFLPSTTKGALDYVEGFLANYKKTGLTTWQHIPEVCLHDAQKFKPILQDRYSQYLLYHGKCSSD